MGPRKAYQGFENIHSSQYLHCIQPMLAMDELHQQSWFQEVVLFHAQAGRFIMSSNDLDPFRIASALCLDQRWPLKLIHSAKLFLTIVIHGVQEKRLSQNIVLLGIKLMLLIGIQTLKVNRKSLQFGSIKHSWEQRSTCCFWISKHLWHRGSLWKIIFLMQGREIWERFDMQVANYKKDIEAHLNHKSEAKTKLLWLCHSSLYEVDWGFIMLVLLDIGGDGVGFSISNLITINPFNASISKERIICTKEV